MGYRIEYSEEKNQLLKETRGICFEDIVGAYEKRRVIDDIKSKTHPNQRILIVKMKEYIYAVPYVVDGKKRTIFLKTIYPSRVLVKKYMKEKI